MSVRSFFIELLSGRRPASRPKRVIINAQHGLGNRWRAYLSAQVLADKTDRQLLLVWQPDAHCQARFSDLFETSLNVVESAQAFPEKSMQCYNYMDACAIETEIPSEKNKYIDHETESDIYIISAYSLNHAFFDFRLENWIMRGMRYQREIVDELASYDVKDCIGIHVRMEGSSQLNQHAYEDPGNWEEEGLKNLQYWRAKSHYQNFVKEIERILDDNPSQRFFLCADRKETYKVMQQRFGDNIIYVNRGVYDRSAAQLKYALLDMVLLSRTQYILGSHWSSFTDMAARLGGRRISYAGIHFGDVEIPQAAVS